MQSSKKKPNRLAGRKCCLRSSADLGWNGLTAEAWRHEPGDHEFTGSQNLRLLMLIRGRAQFQRLGRPNHPCEGAEGMLWLFPTDRSGDGLTIRGETVDLLHLNFSNGSAVYAQAGARGLGPAVLSTVGGFHDSLIETIARALLSEMECADQRGALFADAAAAALEAYLLRRYSRACDTKPASASRGALSADRLDRALTLIDERLSGELALSELAAAANLSLFHFARAFKAATGQAPHRYILERRVALARNLLTHDEPSLAEIATQCGFASQPHLTHVFKRATGLTPGAYRALARRTTSAVK